MTIILLAALCTAVAAIIGGASGFGAAMIATPLMLLAGMEIADVVVINIVVGLLTRFTALYQLRRHVDWLRVALLGGASLPGAWLGTQVVTMVPHTYLKPAAGVLTVVCGILMALPLSSAPQEPSRFANAAMGAVGGFFSTTTSMNGPPVVLLLSRARIPPLSFIADLAGYFVIVGTLSLALLWSYEQFEPMSILPLLGACVVVGLISNQIGMRIAKKLSPERFRIGAICLTISAGLLTVVSSSS